MKSFWKTRALIVCLCLWFSASGLARNVLELQSTYLGDGWFQYRYTSSVDSLVLVNSLQNLLLDFTNRVEYGSFPDDWTVQSALGANKAGWVNLGSPLTVGSQQQTFLVRSSQTNFRMAATQAAINYGLNTLITPGVDPGVFAAQFPLQYLQPCAPSEADNSPTNYVFNMELVPEIVLNRLNFSGTNLVGVTYNWAHSDATMQLEASTNLKTWTPVAQIYGTAGANTWTAETPLNNAGNYFRLSLLGLGRVTGGNLTFEGDGSGDGSVEGQYVSVALEAMEGGIRVKLATVVGGKYRLKVTDRLGTLAKVMERVATARSESFELSASELPSPAFFRAYRLD